MVGVEAASLEHLVERVAFLVVQPHEVFLRMARLLSVAAEKRLDSSQRNKTTSRISPIKYERPRQSASVNAGRLIPRPGAVISFRAASCCCKRCLEIMSPPSFSLSITLIES